LYEQTGTTAQIFATGVESFSKYWGYATNTTTGDGQQQDVLAIKKYGQAKPKIFLNGNFNTDYVKEMLFCQQKTLTLNGDLVYDGNTQILSGCDVLRCENGQILAHQLNSQIKLYSNLGTNNYMGRLRGSSGYLATKKWILASEELTNKTGIVNRPLDKTFRRFDHGVHEFAHALQQLCNWIAIVDTNNMCNAERNRSSECFCYDTQNWFNSNAPNYTYPGQRATVWFQSPTISSTQRADYMKKIFNEANTWMPSR
jgi:hypothetical protein